MKNRITMIIISLLYFSVTSSGQCTDDNEYVEFKNSSGTGYITLQGGLEEKAAQTYLFSGPGSITRVYLEGDFPTFGSPGWWFSADLTIGIYNVDANNRPTSLIDDRDITWYYWENSRSVNFGGGGIAVNGNFALVVELDPEFTGQQFFVRYTGDGEGNNEDLPSKAGTSTGGNWVSLLPTSDGDLYIYPRMSLYNNADFEANSEGGDVLCNIDVNETVNFTDMSDFTTDYMFNTIGLTGYTGSETFWHWDFGDGNTSTMQNPTHMFTSPGLYTVTLTTTIDTWPMGGSVCDDTHTMDISVGLDVSGNPTNLTCHDDASGEIALTGLGGDNSSYSYSLNGSTWQSSSITGLDAGTYDIWVQDGSGCIEQGTGVTITQPSAIVFATATTTTATCGNADGGIQVTASGGTGTLQYSVDGSTYQATGTFTGLTAGIYTVYVKDANNCIKTKNIAVQSTDAPSLFIQSYTNVSCFGGNDGTITLIGSGGTGALQYSIDGTNFQSTGNFTSVSAGVYNPIVEDAAGCVATILCMTSIEGCGITISEPGKMDFGLTSTPTLCNGSSNGTITVVGVTGGTGNKTYSLNGVNFQSSPIFTGLAAGNYNVTVKDAAGCTKVSSISVSQPAPVVVSIDNVTNLSCFESGDGQINGSATGGSGEFTFSLDGINFNSDGDFSDLSAGSYVVTAKDENGCLANANTTISQPTQISANLTPGTSTCGNATGTLLAIATGGSGSGYIYTLDDGSTPITNTTGSFSSLAGGSYVLNIEDGNGCENNFNVVIGDSDGPTIDSYTSTDPLCNGGSNGTITITGVTGTSPYVYSVDGGPFQTSNILTGLDAGDHTVLVKDALGCLVETTITLGEPTAISVVLITSDADCYGEASGSINVNAGGGTGALAYSINGVTFQSPSIFNNLSAGTYTITVKDAGQCTKTAVATINQPSQIVTSTSVLDVSCYGFSDGAINTSAVGGTGTILYSINGINYQSSGTFSNLNSASYLVYHEDANGCTVEVPVNVDEPAEIVVMHNISDVSCAGGDDGVIDITVNGGTPPFSFNWSNFATTEDIFNLDAGTYSVNITDFNGCLSTSSFTVNEPSNPIVANGTVVNATGASNTDGAVDVTITGGTMPYTYNWSNGATTEDLNGVAPGVYVLTVVDANGCELTSSYTVSFTIGFEEEVAINLDVYPNPARDIVYIVLNEDVIAEKVEMVNVAGQVVLRDLPVSNKVEIDAGELAEGLYFINIYVGNNVVTKKIVINR